MKISEIKKDTTLAQYSVSIPAKSISSSIDTKLAEYGEKADIPGFRKGKAPKSILQKRFGENAFGEVVNSQIQNSVEKIVKDNSIRGAMQPKIDVKTADIDKDLEFSIEFVLMPEIEIMDLSKIKIETIKSKVSDKEVDEALVSLAKDFRDSKEVEREAKKGDAVIIDFLGKVDDIAFEGGAGNDHNLELGSNSFIPGFEDQLIGVKAGDNKDVNVKFPDEYHAPNLAGKDAVFECKIKEVKEFVETKIDDEMAKKVGLKDLAELKDNVKNRLSSQFDGSTRNLIKKDLMNQLDAGHKFDVPSVMVQQEFDEIWKSIQQSKEQGKLECEDANKSDKELEKEYKEIALRRVRLGLLLTEIANELKVEVTQDDINRAVMNEAQRYSGQEMQVFEYYQKNPQILEQLKAPILEEKVVDVILEKADTKEKLMDAKDIEKMLNDEDDSSDKKNSSKKTKAKKASTKNS